MVVGRKSVGFFSQTGIQSRFSLSRTSFRFGPDLLHVLHQAVGLEIKLLDAAVDLAVGNPERHRLLVQSVGFVIARGGVGLLHQVRRGL